MNTIVRSQAGYVLEVKTVAATVKALSRHSGYIKIDVIKESINAQLSDRKEHFTRKMVVQALVKILGKYRNH